MSSPWYTDSMSCGALRPRFGFTYLGPAAVVTSGMKRTRTIARTVLANGSVVSASDYLAISEAQFLKQVVELAKLRHWSTYHTWRSDNSESGWPDLVLCRPPRVIFAELKTNTGVVDPAQQAWLDALEACGLDVQVWRPVDWPRLDAYLV